MSEHDEQSQSPTIASPRPARPRGPTASATATPGTPTGGRSDEDAPDDGPSIADSTPIPRTSSSRRPRQNGNPLGLQLLKRALFPKRTQPVQIGRFSVLRLIGCGGMGAVYACYDDALDRKVAVKILQIETTRDREVASSRLVREGQALARLSHPNVVTVHEVGRTKDEVYVAMEFIHGTNLETWAAHPRPWREVLSAFIQAGRGLMAAHRVGIVHRDFKPQNVLINDEGLVKVLDFGLARASGAQVQDDWFKSRSEGAEATTASSELMQPMTVTGALIGTPAYMSPEQYRGELVTAASDQFSFCVALYQCLYGVLPFSTRSLGELRSDILNGRVAPAPVRSLVPARSFQCLRRGMSVDPADRYPSMNELLAALEPKRTSRKVQIAGLVTAAALTGATGFLVANTTSPSVEICPDAQAELAGIWDDARVEAIRGAVRATGSPRADEVLTLVEPQLGGYANAWRQMRNETCLTHAEGRQAERVFELRMACLDQRRAGLLALVRDLAAADAKSLAGLTQAAAALPPLDRCADASALLAAISPPNDPGVRARVQTHRERLAEAMVLYDAGKYRLGLELVEGLAADEAAMAHAPFAAEVELHRGFLQWGANDLESAERSLERAMLTAVRADHGAVAAQASSRLAYLRAAVLHQLDRARLDLPMVEALNSQVEGEVDLFAEYLNNTGWIKALTGDRPEAARLLEAANDLRIKHGRERTPQGLGTLMNLGFLARGDGRIEDMERIFRRLNNLSRELFGPTAPYSTHSATSLADSLLALGRPREALGHGRVALSNAQATKDDYLRSIALFLLAQCELEEGDAPLARQHLEAALSLNSTASVYYDDVLHLLMNAAAAAGDEAAMRSFHQRAVERLETESDPIGYRQSMLLYHHGLALETLGRPREAVEQLERLQSSLPAALVAANPDTVPRLALALGRAYRKAGELDLAEPMLRRALTELEQGWPIQRAEALREAGLLALARRDPGEALQYLTDAESLYAATAEPDFTPLAETRFALARALSPDEAEAPDSAHQHAEAALAAFRAKDKTSDARAVEAWLADHR